LGLTFFGRGRLPVVGSGGSRLGAVLGVWLVRLAGAGCCAFRAVVWVVGLSCR